MIPLLIVFFPAAIGILLISGLESSPLHYCRHQIFRLLLGTGIGIGLCSECYFLGLVSGLPGLGLEAVLLMAAGIAVALKRADLKCGYCEQPAPAGRGGSLTRYLACAFGFLLLLDLTVFIWVSVRTPRGGWDAWAIWNLRAHFLYRGGAIAWQDGFTEILNWSHPDYPLLLPAFVARGWTLLGRESDAVPAALACFFTFGCAALTACATGILRGAPQGLLAGIAIAATPMLYVQGAMQCADVPVAFFRIASLAALAMAERFKSWGFAVLAGAAAALDAWTKNEGLLWIAALLLAWIIVTRSRMVPAFMAGALPVLMPILYFKARVSTESDIFGAAGRSGMVARALDPARYSLIAREGLRHIWNFGPLLFSAFAILALYLVVAGLQTTQQDRAILRTGVLASSFTAAGYFLIYLLRPLDLAWLLDTSADRLLIQLWPGIVFLVFLGARAPHFVPSPGNAGREIMQPAEPGRPHPVHG